MSGERPPVRVNSTVLLWFIAACGVRTLSAGCGSMPTAFRVKSAPGSISHEPAPHTMVKMRVHTAPSDLLDGCAGSKAAFLELESTARMATAGGDSTFILARPFCTVPSTYAT